MSMTPPPSLAIKCDRYEECQQRDAERLRRIELLEEQKRADDVRLWAAVTAISNTLAEMKGSMRGYLLAAGVLGSVVAFIAQHVMK